MRKADYYAAGLKKAMQEERRRETGITECSKHANWVSRGYKFCPVCGQPINFVKVCDGCKRRFTSLRAFAIHLTIHEFPKHCPDPECKSQQLTQVNCVASGFAGGEWTYVHKKRRGKHWWHCAKCNLAFLWYRGKVLNLKAGVLMNGFPPSTWKK